MSDRHPASDGDRQSGVGMQHAPVLQVALLADDDSVTVGTEHCAVPDATPLPRTAEPATIAVEATHAASSTVGS